MEIKANISSLEDILADNRKFYQIPDYQDHILGIKKIYQI